MFLGEAFFPRWPRKGPGRKFQKVKFEKAPESLDQQVQRLIDRGMVIPDRAEAVHYLGNLNYYRLAAYWRPFEADHETHRFRSGTEFGGVLNLYVFDRELRLLVMDAVERVEVSVRARLAHELSLRYGNTHPHLAPELFRDQGKYREMRAKLEDEAGRSPEEFVRRLAWFSFIFDFHLKILYYNVSC